MCIEEPIFSHITIRIPNYEESMFSLLMRGYLALCLAGEKEKAEEFKKDALQYDSEHLFRTVHQHFTLQIHDD